MKKLGCAKCGGTKKMKLGGSAVAKAPVNMYGIPQENMGTSSQMGFGKKGGTLKVHPLTVFRKANEARDVVVKSSMKKMQTGGAKKTVKKINDKTSFKAGLKAGPETLKKIDDTIEKKYPNYTGPTSFYTGLKSGAKTLLGYKKGGVVKSKKK